MGGVGGFEGSTLLLWWWWIGSCGHGAEPRPRVRFLGSDFREGQGQSYPAGEVVLSAQNPITYLWAAGAHWGLYVFRVGTRSGMMGWINGNGVSGAVSTPRASEPTILGAKVLPYLQLRAFPSCYPGACDCRAASCVNSVYANECVCIRVCEYECKGMCVNGFQLESKNPQCWRVFAPLSPDHGSRGRQRALRVSVLAYRTPWGKQVKARAANPKELPFWLLYRSLCLPRLERRRTAKSVLPISHLQSFLPTCVQ